MAYQRVVCFKFKKNASEEAIEKHMNDFKRLAEVISHIASYRGGKTVPGDHGVLPEYHSMHYLTFESRQDIELYFHDREHQRFIQDNQAIWDGVFVLNSNFDQ